jgi:TetR/AcrR family transcriptional regulator
MLENPAGDKITTAALAAELQVSEAALYRHFASKAKMFEALIDFIEESLMGLVHQICERDPSGWVQAARITSAILQFAQKNPGMARVMVGDALVGEHTRLQARIDLLFDKLESALRQSLRPALVSKMHSTPTVAAQLYANLLISYALGRIHRFVRSQFKLAPFDHAESAITHILSPH